MPIGSDVRLHFFTNRRFTEDELTTVQQQARGKVAIQDGLGCRPFLEPKKTSRGSACPKAIAAFGPGFKIESALDIWFGMWRVQCLRPLPSLGALERGPHYGATSSGAGLSRSPVPVLASKRSAGSRLVFKGREHTVEELTPEAFQGTDLVHFLDPDDVARDYLPAAVAAGATVIDESVISGCIPMSRSSFRKSTRRRPGCDGDHIQPETVSTTQMALALKPLHDAARGARVIVSTYQAVSGAGLQGNADLLEGTRAALNGHALQMQGLRTSDRLQRNPADRQREGGGVHE